MISKNGRAQTERTKAKNKKRMIAALEKTLGVVTPALKLAKISHQTHYNYLHDDEEYRAEVDRIQEVALDFVESQNFKLIQNGNPAATIFYLKTKGRDRGYIEKKEIEAYGKGGSPLIASINDMTEEEIDDEISRLENEE